MNDERALSGPHETAARKSDPIIRPGTNEVPQHRPWARQADAHIVDLRFRRDRGARHRIQVDYAASYIYLPRETISGGPS
jgi:hypothetical protein